MEEVKNDNSDIPSVGDNEGIDVFYELLQLGIGTRVSLEREMPLPESMWTDIMGMARKQAVVGILMDGIMKLPACLMPPSAVRQRGIQLLLKIEAMNRRLNRETVMVDEYLRKDGYECTILKGQGLARYYVNPLHRMPGDIDVWPDAEPDELREYGSRKFPEKEWTMHHTHMPILEDTDVELHFQPSYMNCPITNRRLLDFCRMHRNRCASNKVMLEGNVKTVAVATDAFNRVYVLQHIMRHLFGGGIGLRQMMDYCMVLRKGMTDVEKKETLDVIDRLNMRNFAGAVMYVLQRVFAMEDIFLLCAPDERKGKRLLREIMEGGNFGFYDKRETARNLPGKVKKRVRNFFRTVSLAPAEAAWNFFFVIVFFFKRRWYRYKSVLGL